MTSVFDKSFDIKDSKKKMNTMHTTELKKINTMHTTELPLIIREVSIICPRGH